MTISTRKIKRISWRNHHEIWLSIWFRFFESIESRVWQISRPTVQAPRTSRDISSYLCRISFDLVSRPLKLRHWIKKSLLEHVKRGKIIFWLCFWCSTNWFVRGCVSVSAIGTTMKFLKIVFNLENDIYWIGVIGCTVVSLYLFKSLFLPFTIKNLCWVSNFQCRFSWHFLHLRFDFFLDHSSDPIAPQLNSGERKKNTSLWWQDDSIWFLIFYFDNLSLEFGRHFHYEKKNDELVFVPGNKSRCRTPWKKKKVEMALKSVPKLRGKITVFLEIDRRNKKHWNWAGEFDSRNEEKGKDDWHNCRSIIIAHFVSSNSIRLSSMNMTLI